MAAVRNSAATKHTSYLNTSFYKLHISKIIANRTLAIISIVIIHFKDFSRSQAVNVPETVKDTDFLLQIMIIVAENTGRENDAKNYHMRTIAQLCRVVSSQLRHVSTIGKNLLTRRKTR